MSNPEDDDEESGAGCGGGGEEIHVPGEPKGPLEPPEVGPSNNLEIVAQYVGGAPFSGIAIIRMISSRTEVTRLPLTNGQAFLSDVWMSGPHVVQACFADGTVGGSEIVTIREQSTVVITVKAVSE